MRSARGRQNDERGAVIPVVALAMVVILGIAMLAVDLGVQRVARRDMQRLADAVALDLSRLIDGRTASQIEAGNSKKASLAAAKAASVSRNKGTTLGHDTDVTATLVTLDALGSPVRNGDGSLRVASGSAVPDAVLVRATTQVNFAFHGGQGGAGNTGTGDGDGSLGVPRSEACFKLGSFAAALTAANTPILNRYLNSALNLNAVSYQGLAGASMTLGELAAELGAGSTSELASIKNLSLRELFSASAAVLTSQGGSAAAVSVLQTLATTVDGSLLIDMDEVIDLSTGSSAALATSMNVLDLVAGAAFVANGNSFLNVPVMWNVPQFSNGSLNMQIIEGPQMACGKVGSAQVETAQVRFQAAPTLNVPSIAGLNGSAVPVLLDVSLAGASGLLTGITCGEATAASPESLKVNVSRQLSSVNLSVPIRLTGSIKALDVLLPAGFSLFGLL
uniref:pilus assembly protein TadG-related protein n=1 Tax=Nocardioides sp. TaxID=35761 RepID=UPI0035661541